jgi:hypothetical protein
MWGRSSWDCGAFFEDCRGPMRLLPISVSVDARKALLLAMRLDGTLMASFWVVEGESKRLIGDEIRIPLADALPTAVDCAMSPAQELVAVTMRRHDGARTAPAGIILLRIPRW